MIYFMIVDEEIIHFPKLVLAETWDGSSHGLTVDDINRKNKNTWSLLKLVSIKSILNQPSVHCRTSNVQFGMLNQV